MPSAAGDGFRFSLNPSYNLLPVSVFSRQKPDEQ
jgi:hypothetical protein